MKNIYQGININAAGADYFIGQAYWLLDRLANYNTIIYGAKGSGKDMLIALYTALSPRQHYSNIRYNAKSIVSRSLNQLLSVGGNTYRDLVNGTVQQFPQRLYDDTDIIVSDAGIYFGSQNNSAIDSEFPDLAIFEAVSRHLRHNIIMNTQALGRIYIKIREQTECFLSVISTEPRDKFFLTTAISYENIAAAEGGLLPLPASVTGRARAEYEQKYGKVEYHTFLTPRAVVKYNTYYFADLFYSSRLQPIYTPTAATTFWR